MLQPCDDALRDNLRLPAHTRHGAPVADNPIIDQRAGMGSGDVSVGLTHMPQPLKIVQGLGPSNIGCIDSEG